VSGKSRSKEGSLVFGAPFLVLYGIHGLRNPYTCSLKPEA
jgi:hypothetical protein